MRRILLVFTILLCALAGNSQSLCRYVVKFSDKGDYSQALSEPERFLSARSLERRATQGIELDSIDAPLAEDYVSAVAGVGKIVGKSRWHNAVMVELADGEPVDGLAALDFVNSVEKVGTYTPENFSSYGCETEIECTETDDELGIMEGVLSVNGITEMHRLGFDGEGMLIAVTDDGFCNMDIIDGGWKDNIFVEKDFVAGKDSLVYRIGNHGVKVMSCMATDLRNKYVGSAPGAQYALLRTEYLLAEEPAEEYYWTFAAEYADSIGADIINVSLGYSAYDAAFGGLEHEDLDGSRTISRSADIAVSRGMVVVGAAGNEGNKPWRRICVPGDAFDIITVGALDNNFTGVAGYSSVGPSADGRIKPDVTAPGAFSIVTLGGTLVFGSGTSFASPLVAGGVACLWQALPMLKSCDIIDIVKKSGNSYSSPDNSHGYGTADFFKAYSEYTGTGILPEETGNTTFRIAGKTIYAGESFMEGNDVTLSVYSVDGKMVYEGRNRSGAFCLSSVDDGIYLVNAMSGSRSEMFKVKL